MQVCFSLHLFFKGSIVSCNNCMYAEESLGMRRDKCPHVIVPHVHEQYRNLQTVNLEVKVVMNESLEM